ncbi:UNVERIFIED_CONTAM: PH, RCC1 and FYVE domains-containing protein 1 [Sesamum angustifolium]|uniref:PH, RCC1 and FYVE domains-containing protein 1 n=1 Tax=Sesamum angustifolium TaxID=2727405 RepID=A0AAW2IVH5_9LAMI
MSTLQSSPGDRDTVQAINALKKGSYLLKYGRWGKPKFCPFRLSNDEKTLIWYVGEEQKQLQLSQVSRIIPGQRTAIFQRYPQPEKEYQSFSLIYGKSSLDVICKDKYEAEIWFVALRALISRAAAMQFMRIDIAITLLMSYLRNCLRRKLRKAFSDVVLHKAASLCSPLRDSVLISGILQQNEDLSGRNSADSFRHSFSSAISTSSPESSPGDGPLSNIFMGRFFSWGDGSGGKLGHGLEADISNPKLIDGLSGLDIVSIGCGEYHTCAVTLNGDLYTWGDGIHNFGLLGHGTEFSSFTPRKVMGQMEGICVTSISCGPWHSAAITSLGQLFTFGDGTFGALGHGDRCCTSVPREVEALKGQKVVRVSCGFWHTAAIVEDHSELPSCSDSLSGKLFSWGNGDEGQLGHGNTLSQLVPCRIKMPNDRNFRQVACGQSITVALTICGQVYTMGTTDCGEVRLPGKGHTLPMRIEGKIKNAFIKEISCGSHHVVAVTSKSEVFTWGKGRKGQLGHGDNADRNSPTLVKALEGKQVKRIACGNNFTAAICLHQWACAADYSICAGCRAPFNFKRTRHNCYNCGLGFCKACTNKKSLNASLAPNLKKSYRVCEDCFSKLNKGLDSRVNVRPPRSRSLCIREDSSKEKKKDLFKVKQRSILSRLSSFDSFRRSTKKVCKKNQRLNSNSTPTSPLDGVNFGSDISFASSPSTSMIDNCEKINASLPGSKMHSPSSPFSSVTSTPHYMLLTSSLSEVPSHEEGIDDSKQTNDDLTEEISILREQVEVLTRKSEFLAAELERTSDQLIEATAWVQAESQKNNSAKEAIKCQMSQLKEMAAKIPQAAFCRASGSFPDMCHVLSTGST